jgi:hypothetical protein
MSSSVTACIPTHHADELRHALEQHFHTQQVVLTQPLIDAAESQQDQQAQQTQSEQPVDMVTALDHRGCAVTVLLNAHMRMRPDEGSNDARTTHLQQALAACADTHTDFFDSEDAKTLGFANVKPVLFTFFATVTPAVILYGYAALRQMMSPAHALYATHRHTPQYEVYSANARTYAIQLAHKLAAHQCGDVQVWASAHHPCLYTVYVCQLAVASFCQVSQILMDCIDKYSEEHPVNLKGLHHPDSTGNDTITAQSIQCVGEVQYCGPLWLRLDLYQRLSTLASTSYGATKHGLSLWDNTWHVLEMLNQDSAIEGFDLQQRRVWREEEMFEQPYEDFIHQDPLHQDLYHGIMEFVANRSLVVFGASREAWLSCQEIIQEAVATVTGSQQALAKTCADLALATNHGNLIKTQSRVEEPEFDILSDAAKQDAEELAEIMKQFLYKEDVHVTFHVHKQDASWMFPKGSYAVAMTEKIPQEDGTCRVLTDTLVTIHDSADHLFEFHRLPGVSVATAKCLTRLLMLQYYSCPDVHFRNRVMYVVERMLQVQGRLAHDTTGNQVVVQPLEATLYRAKRSSDRATVAEAGAGADAGADAHMTVTGYSADHEEQVRRWTQNRNKMLDRIAADARSHAQ